MEMKTIHVIFKTHLDVGFTDTAKNVVDQYIDTFIPSAMATALTLNENKEHPEFIWTTGAYLIWEFLRRAKPDMVEKMRKCIKRGYIRWHGLPFTVHTELLDKKLLEFGMTLSKDLDAEFDMKTIASKMTDVPGHTIGLVPILEASGIEYLHLGVNPASKVPYVPTLFVWRHQDGSELIVNYAKGYGELNEIEGFDHILHFAHTDDNQGPPTAESVTKEMNGLRDRYPDCLVMASTLDAYAAELGSIKSFLPVVTSEIGDTWIHGVGTDPMKVADYRLLLGMRDKWLEEGSMSVGSAEYKGFSLPLLLIAEHTWGMDHKKYMSDYRNYSLEDLANARTVDEIDVKSNPEKTRYISDFSQEDSKEMAQSFTKRYSIIEDSWQEQRDYLVQAVEALSDGHKTEVQSALEDRWTWDRMSYEEGAESLSPLKSYELGGFKEVVFGGGGELIGLKKTDGRKLALGSLSFGRLVHRSYDHVDYAGFAARYNDNYGKTYRWSDADFGKPGLEFCSVKSGKTAPVMETLHHYPVSEKEDLVMATLTFDEAVAGNYGLPIKIEVTYHLSGGESVEVSVRILGKEAVRLPEALWVEARIPVDNTACWNMEKLSSMISPIDIVSNGNRHLHAVENIVYEDAESRITLSSPTTPLVSVGRSELLTFDNKVWNIEDGFYYNMYNNIWGTNFPAWVEGDLLCQFHMNWL